jgi:hypothetical protein
MGDAGKSGGDSTSKIASQIGQKIDYMRYYLGPIALDRSRIFVQKGRRAVLSGA